MTLKLQNTLTRKKEPFKPLKRGEVSLYTCGPTVYDAVHIGNLRTYVFEDTLRRWLRYGHRLNVRQVMNITDVEDKIIKASHAKTVADLKAYTRRYEERFFADLNALRVERAEAYPRATAKIKQMIAMANRILRAGYAYERDGSVYFDVRRYDKDHTYGQLIKVDFQGFDSHHRIDNDEYDKEHVQDFALWKAVPKSSPGWESPWSYGRPGWHLECSVMAGELAATVDLHAGAVDLKFPHHENEIAQTQAANGQPLARIFLHAEHLLVDGQKMAKSQHNFYTLSDVTAKGFSPLALRLLFLNAHYRSKLNFTWKSLAAVQNSYMRIQELLCRLDEEPPAKNIDAATISATFDVAKVDITKVMDDDLNTAGALAVIFNRVVNKVHAMFDRHNMVQGNIDETKAFFTWLNQIFSIFTLEQIDVPEAVQALVAKREKVRQQKDFKASDALRQQIAQKGFSVEDTDAGSRLRRLSR